jgi:hypothetical protein
MLVISVATSDAGCCGEGSGCLTRRGSRSSAAASVAYDACAAIPCRDLAASRMPALGARTGRRPAETVWPPPFVGRGAAAAGTLPEQDAGQAIRTRTYGVRVSSDHSDVQPGAARRSRCRRKAIAGRGRALRCAVSLRPADRERTSTSPRLSSGASPPDAAYVAGAFPSPHPFLGLRERPTFGGTRRRRGSLRVPPDSPLRRQPSRARRIRRPSRSTSPSCSSGCAWPVRPLGPTPRAVAALLLLPRELPPGAQPPSERALIPAYGEIAGRHRVASAIFPTTVGVRQTVLEPTQGATVVSAPAIDCAAALAWRSRPGSQHGGREPVVRRGTQMSSGRRLDLGSGDIEFFSHFPSAPSA